MATQQSINERLTDALDLRKKNNQFRSLRFYEGHDFHSNDYLGLAQGCLGLAQGDLGLAQGGFGVAQTEKEQRDGQYAVGSTGSRLISGQYPEAEAFEKNFASVHGFEHCLLFSSGYSANVGLLACIGQTGDLLLLDSLIHASSIDGARLSKADKSPFKHNDLDDLQHQLEQFFNNRSSDTQQVFVIIESLYSMDGDIAPLQKIVSLCQRYGASLIVDEAHSIGVYGEKGEGLVSALNLQADVFAVIYTFGKAMGCHGAVIAGTSLLRDYLINFCRPFIYTTAPSPQTINTLSLAHQRLQQADEQRQQLRHNIDYFNTKVKSQQLKNGAYWLDSDSAIQALILGDQAKVLEQTLHHAGFAIKAIVSPTVAAGSERLRVCLHSSNTEQQIDEFADVLINEGFMERS